MAAVLDISSWLIKKGINSERPLSNLSIQKLLYFAQGLYLNESNGDPLFDEPIYAWKLGPVVKHVYHVMKDFGPLEMTKDKVIRVLGTQFLSRDESLDGDIIEFMESLWNVFGDYSASELVNMTHVVGSPWYTIYQKYNGDIPPNILIPRTAMREYFQQFVQ